MDTRTITNVSKMDKVFNTYAILQIIERMYNNYYRHCFWPALVQVGIFSVCISSALCLTKWNLVSNDPPGILLLVAILESSTACMFGPYIASKVNTASRLFLINKCSGFANTYTRKRILSKRPLSIKIADNFMDSQFPLSVLMFCVNNIFTLAVVFRNSG